MLEPAGACREIARLQTRADGTFAAAFGIDPQHTFWLASDGPYGAAVAGAR